MKKYVIVNQTHLYNKEKNIMYKGSVFFIKRHDCITLRYMETEQTEVIVTASESMLHIERKSELCTNLYFRENERTKGSVLSEFGTIEVDIFTHKYIYKENAIAIEYDILQGEMVSDGFRIIWNIKEEEM